MSERRVLLHALPVALLSCFPLHAQIVGDAAFLQGDHLEIGVSACGAYGTAQAPPVIGAAGTAYHPTETGLGFVADGDADGWSEGFPPYCGDYFLPGSPVEGFALAIGGVEYANHSGYGICGVEDIPGGIIGYTDGDTISATWEGTHADGFRLRIRTFFPSGKRYFIGEVTLENTTATAFEDIYFSRQVDPDNDQAWGGGFQTTNRIASQPGPGRTDALATATGNMGCFIGLGARHFASRASRGGFFLTNATDPYCGEAPYRHEGTELADDAIGVNFYFARLGAGQSLTFHYAYILDVEQLEEALEATAAPMLVADGLPLVPETADEMPRLGLCAGDSVFLEVQGGDFYAWEWTHRGDFRPVGPNAGWLKPATGGTYSVGTPVPCGEDLAFSFDVVVGDPASAVAAIDSGAVCPGGSIALGQGPGTAGLSVTWAPARFLDDAHAAAPVARFDTADARVLFTLSAVDTLGCRLERTVPVTVHPTASVSAGPDQVGVIGQRVFLQGSGAEHYDWAPASYLDHADRERPSAIVTDTVLFTVTGTDANGCTATDQVWVFGTPDQRFTMPNAFTPDADGLNDCFSPGVSFQGRLLDLRIFNRWGDVVFRATDPQACWDGTFAGQPQPMGAYVVQLRYADADGTEHRHSGSLTLIR
jgi:gliding motility-associated-like protein